MRPGRNDKFSEYINVHVVSLNGYLFRIGKSDSPFCISCNEVEEDVAHFIMMCPRFDVERGRLRLGLESLGVRDFSLRLLLTGGGFKPNISVHVLRLTFIYVRDTKRLID